MLGLGACALREITRDFAARPERWTPLLRYGTQEHWSMRVHADTDMDIWLVTWLQKQSTTLHDHGGSAGALTVVSGGLREFLPSSHEIDVDAGYTRSFGAQHVHDVYNPHSAPAVSVHAYSPPLTQMSYYTLGNEGQLELRHTEPTSVPEANSTVIASTIMRV
jgi:Cysteine dioxygenase type I